MSVGVGKVTGIWTFYTVIDFFYELSIFYVYQVRNECRSLQSVIFAVLWICIFNILAGSTKTKGHLGRRRSTWEDNIWIHLRLIEFKIYEYINLHDERRE